MKKIFLIIVACVWVCTQLFAQQIKGKIVDEHYSPIPFVNVVLLSKSDSTFITGVITNKEGVFGLKNHKKDGILKFSCIGYQTIYRSCCENDLGTITMRESSME